MGRGTPKGASVISFDPGEIYYFINPQINSPEPHYHVCLEQAGGGVLLMACCTSQYERRKRYIELTGLPVTTLVYLPPDADNGFRKETFVDCNSCFEFTQNELQYMGSFRHAGRIRPSQLEQIASGMIDSPQIEDYKKDVMQKIIDMLA